MTTAIDFISRSLRTIALLGSDDTVSNADAQSSLSALNDMIDSWSAARLYIYQVVTDTLPAVVSQASYTIGAAGDFNTTRPTTITKGTFSAVASIDYPITPITRDQYESIPNKAEGGIPEFYYYEPSFPLGVIKLWPIPATAGTIKVQSPQQLTQFAALTTDITFPPGYRETIHLGLSAALCNEFAIPLTPQLKTAAANAKRRIRRLNVTVPVMDLPTDVTNRVNFYQSYP